jgi:hypothetical protein
VSLTPQQRAQILYLHQVEGMSTVLIVMMTGLSFSTVRRVVHRSSRQEVPAVKKAAAMRPSSKGRIERQMHSIRDPFPQSSTVVSPATRAASSKGAAS